MLIYLHGFNSSPQSHKAQVLGRYLAGRGLGHCFAAPALPHMPEQAIDAAEAAMGSRGGSDVCFVGSSLGGFYATYLAEKHDAKAVLLNPAVDAHIGLRAYLGPQENLYSGERYELTERHLAGWAKLDVPKPTPGRYLLLVETADEVLDYRLAVARYRGARQVVIEGGDHTLQSFPRHLELITQFAGIASA
jgi:hypothetical protein